jgi:hypothetical protein
MDIDREKHKPSLVLYQILSERFAHAVSRHVDDTQP